jgi:hypothetical protein
MQGPYGGTPMAVGRSRARAPICSTANGSVGAADRPTPVRSYERRSRSSNAWMPPRGLTARITNCAPQARSPRGVRA